VPPTLRPTYLGSETRRPRIACALPTHSSAVALWAGQRLGTRSQLHPPSGPLFQAALDLAGAKIGKWTGQHVAGYARVPGTRRWIRR
jgi:hypothetical protein